MKRERPRGMRTRKGNRGMVMDGGHKITSVECGSSAVECQTRNRESPGSLGIFVLSTMPQLTQLYK